MFENTIHRDIQLAHALLKEKATGDACAGSSLPEIKTCVAGLLRTISENLVVDDVALTSGNAGIDVRWYHSAGGSGHRHTTNVPVTSPL